MKKKILLAVFMVVACSVMAENYTSMIFEFIDGQTATYSSENLKMEISDNNMIVKDANGSATIKLTDLSCFYFQEDMTTVKDLGINSLQSFEVISINGENLGRFNSIEDLRNSYGNGIYLIKSNNQSIKIILK